MDTPKRALITGITGQDGSYLSELLIAKGYSVFGMSHDDDVATAIAHADPDEIYNLTAVSDLGASFAVPERTMKINYELVGTLLHAAARHNPAVRFFQASSSEMFERKDSPQSEQTPFDPKSPYAVAKVRAYEEFIVAGREKEGLFACSAFLFNHESPRRTERFVTRKITKTLAAITLGKAEVLELGNLDAKRDWGFAADYVEAMWRMLQQGAPEDFVVATGEMHTVQQFVEAAAEALGLEIIFEGEGTQKIARDKDGVIRVKVNEEFYRPVELVEVRGDITKVKDVLGWKPSTSFTELVQMMAFADEEALRGSL